MIILARASCTVTVVADGRGVDYTKQQYRLSLSKTELSDGEDWSDTYPLDTGGMYVWVRTLTKYSDSDVPEVSDMYCTFNVVDTIKIGTENLLNNSLFKRGLDKWSTNGGANSIVDDTRFGKALKIDTSGGGYGVYQSNVLQPNTQHTFAVWMKSDTDNFVAWFGFGENFTASQVITTEWKKYTITATSASGNNFTLYHRDTDDSDKGVAYYAQPHLVEGNKIVENFSESTADKETRLTVSDWINSFGVPVDGDLAYLANFFAIKDADGTIRTMMPNGVDDVPNFATGMGATNGTAEALKQAARNAPFAVWGNGLCSMASLRYRWVEINSTDDYENYMPYSNGKHRLTINPTTGLSYIFGILPESSTTGQSSLYLSLPNYTSHTDSGMVVKIRNISQLSFMVNMKIYGQTTNSSYVIDSSFADYEFEYVVATAKMNDGYHSTKSGWVVRKQELLFMNN